jgi:hypothetical protein
VVAAVKDHRFACAACGAEAVVKLSTYEAANVAVGALGWRIGRHPKQPCDFCLQCPKCLRPAAEAA